MHPRPAREPASGRRAGPWIALVLALLASGCQVVEASARNLDELHQEDGRHRYTAALESDLRYFWRTLALQLLRRSPLKAPEPEAIENPAKACLDELLDLTQAPASHPVARALQVSWSAHLALACPWRLSRERALLTLGELAEELEVGEPRELAAELVPAGPAVVAEAIDGLQRAVHATRSGSSRSAQARREDLLAACEAARDLVLDVESGRRVLRVASELTRVTGRSGPTAGVLGGLVLDLERRLISQALAKAQSDEDPFVRAAAVRAAVRAGEPPVLARWIERCEREDELVVRAVLELIRERGLPATGAEREEQLAAVYALLLRPEPGVRVPAMQALASLDEAPRLGLREEEWQGWWLARTGSVRPREPGRAGEGSSGELEPGASAPAGGGAGARGGPR